MANFEDRPWVGMVSSRKLLPPTLILAGLILAIVGAVMVASPVYPTVHVSNFGGEEMRTMTTPGSPWGFVIVGGVVFLAGCAMQVFAWRLPATAANSQLAPRPAPAGADDRDLGRQQHPAPQPG